MSLDVKEKENQIAKMREELRLTTLALQDAQEKSQASDEKSSLLLIKQQAIDKIMDDRDTKIARLAIEVQALKNELAAAGDSQKEHKAMVEDASSAKILAEGLPAPLAYRLL